MRSFLSLLILSGALVAAFALAFVYTCFISPEPDGVTEAKLKMFQKLEAEHHDEMSKVVFAGGSSCSFSIMPKTLRDDFGIRAINVGIGADEGSPMAINLALQYCKQGDTLVVALEGYAPGPLGFTHTPTGSQSIMRLQLSGLWNPVDGESCGFPIFVNPAHHRPTLRYWITLAGKIVLGQEINRYSVDDLGYGGHMTTAFREEEPKRATGGRQPHPLSARTKEQFRKLAKYCDENDITLYFSIPWILTAPDAVGDIRAYNLHIAQQLSEFAPVLYDPNLGAHSDRDLFADTWLHLNEQGSLIRTRIVGESLRDKKFFEFEQPKE